MRCSSRGAAIDRAQLPGCRTMLRGTQLAPCATARAFRAARASGMRARTCLWCSRRGRTAPRRARPGSELQRHLATGRVRPVFMGCAFAGKCACSSQHSAEVQWLALCHCALRRKRIIKWRIHRDAACFLGINKVELWPHEMGGGLLETSASSVKAFVVWTVGTARTRHLPAASRLVSCRRCSD